MKTQTNTLYNTTGSSRTFSGVVNPQSEDNKLSIFDDYNVNEVQTKTKPKGLNNYLFNIMSEATNNENSIFNPNF